MRSWNISDASPVFSSPPLSLTPSQPDIVYILSLFDAGIFANAAAP
jgi:hypothetical protein